MPEAAVHSVVQSLQSQQAKTSPQFLMFPGNWLCHDRTATFLSMNRVRFIDRNHYKNQLGEY